MRIWNPKFSFLVFMIILATSHLSSSRYIHRSLSSEAEQTTRAEFSTSPLWHFPAKSSEASRAEKSQPIYGVSYRTVPGGPNPLHN
ncbi:Uncharacterized protein TCM_016213 [Theobroma cacao]|uniref:Uncharacterized protein n=1 Tax=Theobroma cacao TaxID=3641 RepID=A0A061G4B9_THECC|nr:Uncharacterized protein TCM_016213 [Theobroma cacao]